MGPWPHGGWQRSEGHSLGDADFGFRTSETYLELSLAFFKHHLKEGPKPGLPEALVFETGANRWRSLEAWPPKEVRETRLYFQPQGKLAFQPPVGSARRAPAFASPAPSRARPLPRPWRASDRPTGRIRRR